MTIIQSKYIKHYKYIQELIHRTAYYSALKACLTSAKEGLASGLIEIHCFRKGRSLSDIVFGKAIPSSFAPELRKSTTEPYDLRLGSLPWTIH